MRDESPSEELARLLDIAERHRIRALPLDSLQRLARLYRGESARLSRLRDRGSDIDQIAHLNALCVRAHAFLYSKRHHERRPESIWKGLMAALASTGPYITLSWWILAVGGFVGFFLVRLDPTALYALMPAGMGYGPTQIDALYTSESARDLFFARDEVRVIQNAIFGSALFTHNTRIGMLAFAVGVFGGIPTLLLQFYNGIMVGTISAIFLQGSHTLLYLAWILPHGIPEMTAITLCSAGGLALGHAVAAPGRRTRSEALRRAGPQALALALASVPLFFAAAWIESFIRESALGTSARLGIAGASTASLVGLALLIRRRPIVTSENSDWLEDLVGTPPTQAAP